MKRLLCWLGSHNLTVIAVYSPGTRKVGCRRCRKVWGMHDETRSFVPWDKELDLAMAVLYPLGPIQEGREADHG